MPTTLKLGGFNQGHSVHFNEADDMVEFKSDGLIVAELPIPAWRELDEMMAEDLMTAWRSKTVSDQLIEWIVDHILAEFDDE